MSKRKHPRVVTQQQVDYRHAGGLSGGMLIDLSLHGCRIKGPPLCCGVRLRLQLWLPDQAPALKIEQAVVRWAKTDQFGVSFVEVPSDVRRRLEHVLRILQAAQQPESQLIAIPSSTFSGYDFSQSASDDFELKGEK